MERAGDRGQVTSKCELTEKKNMEANMETNIARNPPQHGTWGGVHAIFASIFFGHIWWDRQKYGGQIWHQLALRLWALEWLHSTFFTGWPLKFSKILHIARRISDWPVGGWRKWLHARGWLAGEIVQEFWLGGSFAYPLSKLSLPSCLHHHHPLEQHGKSNMVPSASWLSQSEG